MGLGKALKKRRDKIGNSLKQAAAQANAMLDEAAGLKQPNKTSTTPTSAQTQPTTNPTPSFLDKINMAASNFQKGMETMQQYDYQVETSKADNGTTTTTVTTKDKATGKVVSRQVHVQEADGTVRVTSSGTATSAMLTTSEQQKLPPEVPTDGSQVEYTMQTTKDKSMIVDCLVKDGPQAGTKLRYRVINDGQDYELIQKHVPIASQRGGIAVAILVVLVSIVLLPYPNKPQVLLEWDTSVRNALCMPVPPYSKLPLSLVRYRAAAPWWVWPDTLKAGAFARLCSGRSRVSVEWEPITKQLSLFQETRKKKTYSNVKSAQWTPSEWTLEFANGKKVSQPAYWRQPE